MRGNDWVGKRKAARQPVNMRGELRFLDGRAPVECLIIDISATGCALELKEAIDVPEDFDLYISARDEVKICKIRRNNGAKLGVAFLKSRLDDPLVMQTLMERVGRLERGFAELKGFAPATAHSTAERRAADEHRRAEDRDTAYAGPGIDDRVQSLALGLGDLRSIVDGLMSAPKVDAAPVDIAPQVDAQSRDIASLKDELANVAKAMRENVSSAVPVAAGAAVDYSADIGQLKSEMTELSVAIREIAASPALKSRPVAAVAAPAPVDTRELARARAEIAELRAAVTALRDAPAADASGLASAQAEIARLREEFEGAMEGAPQERLLEFAEAIGALRAEVASLREDMRALAAGSPQTQAAPVAAVQPAAPADPAIAMEMDELRNAVRTLIVLVSQTLNRLPEAA